MEEQPPSQSAILLRFYYTSRLAGFQSITVCTPIELMEDIQMKEVPEKHPEFDPETYTDPILEECYRS